MESGITTIFANMKNSHCTPASTVATGEMPRSTGFCKAYSFVHAAYQASHHRKGEPPLQASGPAQASREVELMLLGAFDELLQASGPAQATRKVELMLLGAFDELLQA